MLIDYIGAMDTCRIYKIIIIINDDPLMFFVSHLSISGGDRISMLPPGSLSSLRLFDDYSSDKSNSSYMSLLLISSSSDCCSCAALYAFMTLEYLLAVLSENLYCAAKYTDTPNGSLSLSTN